MKKIVLAAVVSSLVTASLTAVAFATPTALAATHDDPDDVDGGIDLQQVTRTYSNGPFAPPMVHLQATTYDRWTLAKCWRRDCRIVFFFDSRQAGGTDRVVSWKVERRRPGRFEPSCGVFDYRYGERSGRLGTGDAAKFRRSAFCSFRKALLDAERRVRWRVRSVWKGAQGSARDRSPDNGWYGG